MVPITSAGSRSGVNWIREKAIRRHSATVRTARVLARPGTPSSRTWPPVSRPISSRSTITSWPTTRFATSRVMVWERAASLVFAARVVIATPTRPLCAPPAPCFDCRVPTDPVLRAHPGGRWLRSPPPAPAAAPLLGAARVREARQDLERLLRPEPPDGAQEFCLYP